MKAPELAKAIQSHCAGFVDLTLHQCDQLVKSSSNYMTRSRKRECVTVFQQDSILYVMYVQPDRVRIGKHLPGSIEDQKFEVEILR